MQTNIDLETIDDSVPVALNGDNLRRTGFRQGVQSDIADVVVPVDQKPPENIHCQHPQTLVRLQKIRTAAGQEEMRASGMEGNMR